MLLDREENAAENALLPLIQIVHATMRALTAPERFRRSGVFRCLNWQPEDGNPSFAPIRVCERGPF
jgi:hypothetical protein